MKYLIIFILTTCLYFGCQVKPGSIKPETSEKIPAWYINTPNDNMTSIFGSGTGASKEEARNEALNQIASIISIKIESKFHSKKTEFNNEYNSITESELNTIVKAIEFTNYRVVKNTMVDEKFYTLVELDREAFYNTKFNEFKSIDNKINYQWKDFENKSIIEKIQISNDLKNTIEKATLSLPVLSVIKERFNQSVYKNKYDKYQEELKYLANNIIVYFNNSNATTFKTVIEKYISQLGATIVDNKNKVKRDQLKNFIIIDIQKTFKKLKLTVTDPTLKNAHFVEVSITITILDSANNTLSKNIISVTNMSKYSIEDAANKTALFENVIKKQGILQILMGNNK